jgi:hypothetical protein
MKKQMLSLAIMAAMIGSVAMGCSSTKKAGGSDSTASDSAKMKAPIDTPANSGADTSKAKIDTTKKDTTTKP